VYETFHPAAGVDNWNRIAFMSGEQLTPFLIRYGYRQGAFPMTTDDDGTISWFQPKRRALLPIEGIHVSHSLAKRIRHEDFEITFDTSFEDVMRCCLRPTDNWISEEIIRVYTQIHHEGWAHSCECWIDGELCGGVYGLAIGGCFCAESMFYRRTDASKVALWAMVNKCKDLGFKVFDAQIMNDHLRSLGAYEISHQEYMRRLGDALKIETAWSRA
jgi:leucyl/phenylalanyl-tRNA---protein transferase